MLSPEQSRAARGWLDWSQAELAKRAGLSLSTVRDFEKGRRTPISNNIKAIHGAFTAEHIKFKFTDSGVPSGIDCGKRA